MTTVRKLLLAVLLVSLAGSAFGAGTFASFNATTTNASSTFATGSLVLTNKTGSGTTCLSTGATGTNTDTNSYSAGCGVLFNTSVSAPNSTATMDLDLTGSGTLTATKLNAFANTACVDSFNSIATYTGTGSACQQVQLAIQEYSSSTNRTSGTTTGGKCWFGAGSAPTITGSTVTINPSNQVTITGANNTLNVTVDGTAVVATIPSATYNYPSLLAAAVQNAIRTAPGTVATTSGQALVGATWSSTANTTSTFKLASGKVDSSGSIAITGGTFASVIGFTTASNTGSAQAAACTLDSAHTLGGFGFSTAGYTSTNSLNLGSLAGNGTTRYFRITVFLPNEAANDVQGRSAAIQFGWRLDQ